MSPSTDRVSKRFFVTVPDFIGDALDRWSEAERNKPATLAAFLLEQSVRKAIDEGKVPMESQSAVDSTPAHSKIGDSDRVLKALIDGSEIDDLTLTLLAKDLGCEPASLVQLFKKIRAKD